MPQPILRTDRLLLVPLADRHLEPASGRRELSIRVSAACRADELLLASTTSQPATAAASRSPVVRSTRYSGSGG